MTSVQPSGDRPSLLALLGAGDDVQPEVDVAQVDPVAERVHAPDERDRVPASGAEAGEDPGRVECWLGPVEADLLRSARVRDVHDPQPVGVPAQVQRAPADLRVVDRVEARRRVRQRVRRGEVAQMRRAGWVGDAPEPREAPRVATLLRLSGCDELAGAEVLGEALWSKTAPKWPRHSGCCPGGGVQSNGAGRPLPAIPNGSPPSLPAPQSSVRTGWRGSVTSSSWKSPTVPPEVISENGTAASANTRSWPPRTCLVSETSWAPPAPVSKNPR